MTGGSWAPSPYIYIAAVFLLGVLITLLNACYGMEGMATDNHVRSHNTDLQLYSSHNGQWVYMVLNNKAEVVDCQPHYRQRCALEAWHIRTEPHKMNRDGGPLYQWSTIH